MKNCELFENGVDCEGNFCRMSNDCDCEVISPDHQDQQEDSIAMPKTAEQAAGMVLVGMSWLQENDPDKMVGPDKPDLEINIEWSQHQKPSSECTYDHVTADTPFGRFLITWKGWKEYDSPTVDESPWDGWFGAFDTVDEAKQACEDEYRRRLLLSIKSPE